MADRSALNAAAQRIARENAAAAANQPPPLEPAFPWSVQAFDPFYFGVASDPIVPIDSQPEAIPTNG